MRIRLTGENWGQENCKELVSGLACCPSAPTRRQKKGEMGSGEMGSGEMGSDPFSIRKQAVFGPNCGTPRAVPSFTLFWELAGWAIPS